MSLLDTEFCALRERLQKKFEIDVSSYPTIDDIMADDSDDSDDSIIINEVPFQEIQTKDVEFNNDILSNDSDSDGFLSDDGEFQEEGRSRGRVVGKLNPVDLDIDENDFEIDDEDNSGDSNGAKNEVVRKNEFISSDEEDKNVDFEKQKNELNDMFKSTVKISNGLFDDINYDEDSEELEQQDSGDEGKAEKNDGDVVKGAEKDDLE